MFSKHDGCGKIKALWKSWKIGRKVQKKKKEKEGKEKKEKQRKKWVEQFFLTYFQIYVSTFFLYTTNKDLKMLKYLYNFYYIYFSFSLW